MVQIKQGRYTELPKGYITYPYNENETNSIKLAGVLLTERQDRRYMVEFGNKKIDEKQISKPLWSELQKIGCRVSIFQRTSTKGRKVLTESNIPVEIRKIMNASKLEAIRIRLTGNTERELLKNIDIIKEYLSPWQIKPKECVWSQGNWREELQDTSKPIVNPEDILKEQQRLKNIVADMQDKIHALEKPLIHKSAHEERKVRSEVLK